MLPMLDRIRERRVGQWTGAYIAAAWVLVEVVDVVAQWWSWSAAVVRAIQVLLALGLPFVVTLAWYHGEKGRQRFSTPEILIIVLLSLIAAAVIRGLGPRLTQTASGRMADSTATTADDGPSAPPTPSIAVLPFGNLSPDPENAFFADGLHDEILVTLDRIEPLRVISRTSVLGYRDTPKSVQTIARELGISHLLEGTVRKTRDQLRITWRLSRPWARIWKRHILPADTSATMPSETSSALWTPSRSFGNDGDWTEGWPFPWRPCCVVWADGTKP